MNKKKTNKPRYRKIKASRIPPKTGGDFSF